MSASLQKKFVRTAMVAVTVLIVLMLGAINVANILMVDRQLEKDLLMLAEHEGGPSPQPTAPHQNMGRAPDAARDTFLSARKPQFFRSSSLYGNIFLVNIHQRSEHGLHGRYVGIEFGLLGADGSIDIADGIAFAFQ